jgi:N-acetylglutamate synthase-like GNAT family acetyltransferase
MLTQPEHYLGAWHDPASGKVYLDVSVVMQDQNRAHQLALDKDQIAYFDLGNFASVTVNAQATSGGAGKTLLEALERKWRGQYNHLRRQ